VILGPLAVLALVLGGALAGAFGALVGIGGGLLMIPMLTLGFGVDLRVATATSLVAVVATSTTSGSVHVGTGLANMRLGMSLEVATALGGVAGGLIATSISTSVLARVFAVLMVVTAALMLRGRTERVGGAALNALPATGASVGSLDSAYYDERQKQLVSYRPVNLALGSAIALVAGLLSGLLGVGGGFLKVPAMHLGMHVPLRVAAATSNFMIGVTAASSLFVYFARGLVHPLLAAPVVLGVTAGSLLGARFVQSASTKVIKYALAAVMCAVAVQMTVKGGGR
jgi:uncharacterized membrane protein YfcA